jgi:hypothetical protein
MAKAGGFYLHDRREGEKTNFKGLATESWRGDVAGHSLPRRQLGGMRGQRTETAPATRMDHSAARQRRDVAGGGGNG